MCQGCSCLYLKAEWSACLCAYSEILVCSRMRLVETVLTGNGVFVNTALHVPPHSVLFHEMTVDQAWHFSHSLLTSLAG